MEKNKPAFRQAIIVEGKYDKIKLESLIDAVIIPTDGFRIFRDKEKKALIKRYAEKNGIIIVTDSDAAGFQIRSHIRSFVKSGAIYHVYIPDVFGKERRKEKPSKEGKLGVEGLDAAMIAEAFARAGIPADDAPGTGAQNPAPITPLRLYEDGLTGTPQSVARRARLLKLLDLPARMTPKTMLTAINTMLTGAEYAEFVRKLDEGEE
ncbi:MAG: DUF4093 domain-containing protein [Oscillospiraceae bacterium]